ncbi:MAG: TonB-dependent receptor [Azonexus sp.]|nr:TonB-dependent receptor [Azonexus sp.]
MMHAFNRKRLAASVALALLSLGAVASTDEEIYFSELPVVASVSRLPQRLADAPTSVTVIDREMLRALPIRDLNDIFRFVPGFQTYPNNTEAARVVYHGLTDEEFSPRVQVLVDGRSMYSPAFRNGVNWALIPVALEDIERIEVVRGTNAVSYGSNAFLGVINIITVDPSIVRGAAVSVSHGTQNVRDQSVRAGGKLGEAGDFRFTFKRQSDDGLENRHDWIDSYSKTLFDFRADFVLTERDSLQFSAGHVDAVTQRGRLSTTTWLSNPNNPIRDFDQHSSYLQLAWRRALSSGSDFQLRYAYTLDEGSDAYLYPVGGVPSLPYDPWGARGVRHELEGQHNLSLNEATRLVWGAGWRRDTVSAATTLADQGEVRRDVGRLFGNVEWQPTNWFTGNLGLSWEDDNLAGEHLAPRLSAAFHLSPENTVRFGASRAYRTGSVVDYRGNWWRGPTQFQFGGDPNMPAEQMDTLEIGYLGDWRDKRMSLDVRLFEEKVYNRLLVIDQDIRTSLIPDQMSAIQNIRMRGLEFQYKWQIFDGTRVLLNQAFIRAKADFTEEALANAWSTLSLWDPTKREAIDELAERAAPRHATSLMVMQKLPWSLELTLAGYWQGKSKWSVNTWADKSQRYDAKLAYPFKWGGQKGELAYVGQSLNGGHPEYKAYGDLAARVVDRRQWITLRLDF